MAGGKKGGSRGQPHSRRHRHGVKRSATHGAKTIDTLSRISQKKQDEEIRRSLKLGLDAADSVIDRNISLFSRGHQPAFAGINTFMKAPYCEDIRKVGNYEAAFVGAPFDSATTYRPGTRFGPQAVRRISALYDGYWFDGGVDIFEELDLCDAGDIFVIPGNIEKTFDQVTKAVSHIYTSGVFPIICGGDHSLGFPNVRGIAPHIDGNVGIIHIDRHIDIQEKDMDERMHTTPWFWTTHEGTVTTHRDHSHMHDVGLPNCHPKNLVQVGIGGWQVPRPGVKEARRRQTNVLTIEDVEKLGLEKTAEIALELAWDGVDAVYVSFDVDSVDCGFVPGTGWPEPGGFLPREALKLLGLVAKEGICGLELVEVSPPYDTSDITALLGVRVVVEALGALVAHGRLGSHKSIIDRPVAV